ncbi:phage tail tube protein [Methylomagnum ishizawai]|uniref:phage tail tube protein n=1 Tax=Methylomagnum ishizawai TaxID=1760988 RepID=UPI001C33166E|nr:hypothetical protein MishRS11D_26740 [Methylomagnum ishizawai]
MADKIFMKNALLLGKAESSYGVDPTPTGSANAYLAEDMTLSPMEGETVDLSYYKGFFGSDISLQTTHYMTLEFTLPWIPGTNTPGTASHFDPLFKACGLAATAMASAVTGTPQGSNTDAITLASNASSTNNIYRGVIIDISPTGEKAVLLDYNGTTKRAGTMTKTGVWDVNPTNQDDYSICQNMAYDPVSKDQGSIAFYYYLDGILHKMFGARGDFELTAEANNMQRIKFTFTGLYGGIADASMPTPSYSAFNTPVPLNSTNTMGGIHGCNMSGNDTGVQLKKFTFGLGNTVKHRQLVGSEAVVISDRMAKGSVSLEMTPMALLDWFDRIQESTTGIIFLQNGTEAGYRTNIILPKAQLMKPKYSNDDNVAMLDMDFKAIWTSGNDEVRLLEM